MNYYFFSVIFMATTVVHSAPLESIPSATSTSTSIPTEAAYLPPVESPPEIKFYEYTPSDGGYTYRLSLTNSVFREETFEIRDKGTPEEETFVNGQYWFKGDDGYKYYIKYTINNNGVHTEIDRTLIHRIPPSTLKSLVG
ncbi:uncharacterized protein LOC129579504 [Sitodiplosis mosellana]|uniref:uncharacterized protein LOC129579504 n=1 Tax=Sitodiplosis mosellana TaxID=263140 RepID=UPI002443BD5F|nr:uncharacterized protein LOC129579504 [Sitodiplosis mosellana]